MENKKIVYGSIEWRAFQYKRKKEENRGKNFEYWSNKHEEMLLNGWSIAEMKRSGRQWGRSFKEHCTSSLEYAKEIVQQKRSEGNFARIIAGMEENRQRIKMFTIIYKPKTRRKQ